MLNPWEPGLSLLLEHQLAGARCLSRSGDIWTLKTWPAYVRQSYKLWITSWDAPYWSKNAELRTLQSTMILHELCSVLTETLHLRCGHDKTKKSLVNTKAPEKISFPSWRWRNHVKHITRQDKYDDGGRRWKCLGHMSFNCIRGWNCKACCQL